MTVCSTSRAALPIVAALIDHWRAAAQPTRHGSLRRTQIDSAFGSTTSSGSLELELADQYRAGLSYVDLAVTPLTSVDQSILGRIL